MRGIYLLPNLFTSANLACGFCAILSVLTDTDQGMRDAAWLILLANVFDLMDGRIARWTNATSRFGVEFDSLADLVAFGVAPGILLYRHALDQVPTWGAVVACAFCLCGALRLARFNVQSQTQTSGPCSFFTGCPIPAAASLVTTAVLIDLKMPARTDPWAFLAVVAFAAAMMVSTVPYPSMKKSDADQPKRRAVTFVMAFTMLAALVTYQENCLFVLVVMYFLSGPMWKVMRLMGRLPVVGPSFRKRFGEPDAKEKISR